MAKHDYDVTYYPVGNLGIAATIKTALETLEEKGGEFLQVILVADKIVGVISRTQKKLQGMVSIQPVRPPKLRLVPKAKKPTGPKKK